MELRREDKHYINGLNEQVDIENTYLFPLLKSSDIFHNRVLQTQRWLLTPQDSIGKDTTPIKDSAPKTWDYLNRYKELLDKRASSIYLNNPPFSIFGVGSYSFTSWKVAISGFYKDIHFRFIEPIEGKPVVFDDTCYFLPAFSKEEAILYFLLLSHPLVVKVIDLLIYREAKRPVTKQLLQQVDLYQVCNQIEFEFIREKLSTFDKSINVPKLKNIFLQMSRK